MDAPLGRQRRAARSRRGFTLIEIMVVVAVVAVLASAAIPQFKRSLYKSRRTEALYGLRAIHDLQLDYYAEHQEYADTFAKLGEPLDSGTINAAGAFVGDQYTFTLDTWDLDGRQNANYRATATGDIDPSDATLDIVIIENRVTIRDD
ncbi:MAG: prepilin-type N-terminal cleavage/methylation domain-containing protein [Myxococcota bacterium]|nr:prepilin-type N-terminal cleavage/methylation domain-containing protein [Myxococcota bacterium]